MNAKRQLDEQGFTVLERFMDAALLSGLRQKVDELFASEGDRAGSEFKKEPGALRLANLADKGDVFRGIMLDERILELIRHVLGPAIKLSSLNARRVPPFSQLDQPLHADMGAIADDKGFWVCNTIWALDDFTAANGTLRVVPGSHHFGKLPDQALTDPRATHPDQVAIAVPAGSVIVMNAHLWHGGLGNHTATSRTAVHVFYCRRDRPQQQYQKGMLCPEVQSQLSSDARDLLALDDPRNDELAAQPARRSGFMK